MTFDLVNGTINSMENLSPVDETEYIDPASYLAFFDTIFPRSQQKPFADPLEASLESMLFQYCQSSLAASRPGLNRGFIETLVLPWLIQQMGLQTMGLTNFPIENVVTARYCGKSYKTSFAPISFYMFAVSCFLTIGWCVVRLLHTSRERPVISLFGDMNLLGKMFGRNSGIQRLSELGSGATSTKVERTLANMNIKVERDERPQWDTSGLELDNLG
jgi:hypothetical protein